MRLSTFGAIFALAGAIVMGAITTGANAAPITVQKLEAESAMLEVRDGCGPGYRYSHSRGGCVPDRGPPPTYYGRQPPPPYYVAPRRPPPPPPYYGGYRAPPPPICPPGQRFSNSRQACVWR